MTDERYFAAAVRFDRRTWIVATASSPMVRYLLSPGPVGEHVRWTTRPADRWRPDRDLKQREWWGEKTLVRGVRVPATPELTWVRVEDWAVAAGWALTAWALWRAVRRR